MHQVGPGQGQFFAERFRWRRCRPEAHNVIDPARPGRTVCVERLSISGMKPTTGSAEHCLALAIQHVNAGQPERASLLCEHALAAHPPHPAVLQLLAVLCLKAGDLARARLSIARSLELRPDHAPSLRVAGDVAHALGRTLAANGNAFEASRCLSEAVSFAPTKVDAWFDLALALHDLRELAGAQAALRQVLALAPPRAEVEVNLGVVLQDGGRIDEAMRAYGRAYRLNEDSFGRIAHALAAANVGRLWLDLDALRETLRGLPP